MSCIEAHILRQTCSRTNLMPHPKHHIKVWTKSN